MVVAYINVDIEVRVVNKDYVVYIEEGIGFTSTP